MSSTPRLYIATPAYGCMVSVNYLASLLNLQIECAKRGIGLIFDIIGNESLVQRGRCLLTERFVASPAVPTHLLFIDADIGFNPEAVFNLLEADKDVSACVYPKKSLNWTGMKDRLSGPQQQQQQREPVRQLALDFNINLKDGSATVQNGGFVSVLDTATGFLLITRRVIETMKEHYRESLGAKNDIFSIGNVDEYVAIFDCMIDPVTRRYLSEDYAFCRRWQQMDPDRNEIWVDIRTPLSHTGNHIFVGDVLWNNAVKCADDNVDPYQNNDNGNNKESSHRGAHG